MEVPYDSEEAVDAAERLMQSVTDTARGASADLARERGSFPNFERSVWRQKGCDCLRNATVTSVAPTGTIGLIAGVSSGIEPVFALSYFRNVAEGTRLLEQNALFEQTARDRGFYTSGLMTDIARTGSVRDVTGIPADVRRTFVTALDISPGWHVRMQAAFQKYTDNGVSKTVNLPHNATLRDVRDAYLLSHELKCKGITVYRYGARAGQTLHTGWLGNHAPRKRATGPEGSVLNAQPFFEVGPEYTGDCTECTP